MNRSDMNPLDEAPRSAPLPRRRVPIYLLGLRQFLLASTAAGIWISLWILQPQVEPLRQSVRAMRAEAGRLVIDDPTRIVALERSELQDRAFRFRVFIPKSPPRTLCLRTRDIDAGSFPAPVAQTPLSPGEHTIRLVASKMPDNSHEITLSVDGEVLRTVREAEDWATNSSSWSSVGKSSQKVFDDEPDHQLLRYKFMAMQPNGSWQSDDGPRDGLLLCISENPPKP